MINSKKQSGFSLIEVSIILIIAGLLLSGIFKIKSIIDSEQKRLKYYASVQDIGSALEDFVVNNGYYPLPASLTANINSSAYGKPIDVADLPSFPSQCNPVSPIENGVYCRKSSRDLPIDGNSGPGNSVEETILIGAVPSNVLGFNNLESLDIYNRKFTYAISRSLTDPATFNDNYGLIRVLSNETSDNALGLNNNHYVVLSHGENQSGSYHQNGTPSSVSCSTLSSMEKSNCEISNTFRVATTGTEDDSSNLNVNLLEAKIETASTYYDDAVFFKNSFTKDKWTRKGTGNVIMTADNDNDNAKILIGRKDYVGGLPSGTNYWSWNDEFERPQVWVEGNVRSKDLLATRICDGQQENCFKINDLASPATDVLLDEVNSAPKTLRCGFQALKDIDIINKKSGHKKGSTAEMQGECETINKIKPGPSALGTPGLLGIICVNGSNGLNGDGSLRCI